MRDRRFVKDRIKHRARGWVLRSSVVVLSLGLVWAGITAGRIVAYMDENSSRRSDAAIILGAAVQGDNPSPVFRERIEQAIRLYEAGTVRNLIFTGGSSHNNVPTEALVGRNYAIAHGVKSEHIQMETESTITEENLVYSLKIGQQEGYRTYTIVSDPLHMKRAMKLATGLGMDAVPSPTSTSAYQSWSSKVPFLARETVMYMGYTIKGWMDHAQ